MSPAFKASGTAARMLADDLRKLHINTQVLRFARLFAIYLAAHWVFPNGFDWQAFGILVGTAVEATFQQMFPQLPLAQVLHAAMASKALRRYLGGEASSSGQPQTVPVSGTPLTAPPAASPAAGTPMTTNDPSADPAQKPQAVPKTDA